MSHRTVNITEFKAKCLALLDEIGERGGTITVTRRGRPLATVGPARKTKWKSLEGAWEGKVEFLQDPLDVDLTDLWEVAAPKPRSRR